MARAVKKAVASPAPPPPTLAEKLVACEARMPSAGRAVREVAVPIEIIDEIHEALKRREVLPIPEELLNEWDRLSGSIDATLTALPSQMTTASDKLSERRLSFRELIQRLAMGR